MQLEPNPERGMKVRLTPEELTRAISHYDNIEDEADDKRYVALALIGRAGLRSFEVPKSAGNISTTPTRTAGTNSSFPKGKATNIAKLDSLTSCTSLSARTFAVSTTVTLPLST